MWLCHIDDDDDDDDDDIWKIVKLVTSSIL